MTDTESDTSTESNERVAGVCSNCNGSFSLSEHYVAYGGLLWCTEQCLAETAVERNLNVERVASKMIHRPSEHSESDETKSARDRVIDEYDQ